MEEKVKNECLRRMKALKLDKSCITDFEKNEDAWASESIGILYWLEDDEREIVKNFESEHEGLKVYHCIRNITEFGRLLTLLYVNNRNEEEYNEDVEYFDSDIKDGLIMSYVCNLDDEWSSEFGSIAFKSMNGGLKRVG